jgi:AcrR family transcriptional regulator
MAGAVKPKRPYNSPRRQEQAAATRRSVLEAARRLFERDGYAATTMEAIATEAGVALKTVYVIFVTKSGLLRALWDVLLKGDDDAAAVATRVVPRGAEAPIRRRSCASTPATRAVKERIGKLLRVIRDGGDRRRCRWRGT